MSIWGALADILILLSAGFLFGAICQRLRQSAVVGYLLAGLLLGPNSLNLVSSQEEVQQLAELGVSLLLFAIGLEFSWARLRSLGFISTMGGVLQVLVTGLVAMIFGQLCGLALDSAIGVGAIVAISSTACVLQQLTAKGDIGKVYGGYVLGILLIQDLAVVALVLLMTALANGGTGMEILTDVGVALGYGVLLFGALFALFHFAMPRLLHTRAVQGSRDLLVLLAVVSGLGSALAAHHMGMSPALGAFAAGVLLAGSPFAVQIRADVSSLRTLLITLFFVSVGMLADPLWMAQNWALVTGTFLAVVVGKLVITWGALRLLGATSTGALSAGFCVAQIGEFSFVLAEIGRGTILSEHLFLLIISTTILTLLITPYLVVFAPTWSARLTKFPVFKGGPELGAHGSDALCVVIGFGPAGRQVADQLREHGRTIMILDMNPHSIKEAKDLGFLSLVGDARYADVLEHVGTERIELIAITIPDPKDVAQITSLARSLAPNADIVARARYHNAHPLIAAAGAHIVVDEEQSVGHQIAISARSLLAAEELTGDPAKSPRSDSD
ncbi:MAG: cation:proton antiporter [Planctomycetota bacterium]|nr:cation:proton antiporter [Planctomycetota bacterium]